MRSRRRARSQLRQYNALPLGGGGLISPPGTKTVSPGYCVNSITLSATQDGLLLLSRSFIRGRMRVK